MAKFLIECPNCGNSTEASNGLFNTGLFGTKRINCTCGYVIDVRTDKMVTRHCENCGNDIILDQSKGEDALCPVCKAKVNTRESHFNKIEITCPSCACLLSVDKVASYTTCPLCDTEIDVQACIAKEKVKKMGLASVIKFEGDDSTFVWKHPIEDFNLGSQLIVNSSQEAIFFRDGRALDLFGEGRYTLATQNLPLLQDLYKLPTNTETPFHSQVYFVDKTVKMAIKWGTPDKIRIKEPLTGVPLAIGASGEMDMLVTDARKLILTLVGTMSGVKWDSDDGGFAKSLQASFRPLIQNAVRNALPVVIAENQIDLVEVDMYTDVIGEKLREKISAGFEEYGLSIPHLYCKIMTPEDDPNFKTILEMHAANLEKLKYKSDSEIRQSKVRTDTDEKIVRSDEEKRFQLREDQNVTEVRLQQEANLSEVEKMKRERELEEQKTELQRATTDTELAKLRAQQKVITAQGDSQAKAMDIQLTGLAEAEVMKAKGLAEGETMRAKGYTQRDVLQADVQKEYAHSLGQIGSNIGGGGFAAGGGGAISGATGGLVGDMLGLGVGIATAKAVAPQIGDMMQGLSGIGQAVSGNNTPAAGAPIGDTWDCSCGNRGIAGKFCNSCGAKRPDLDTWDCTCGNKGIVGKFCSACGAKKPETWDCACGNKGITGAFCSACGAKKPETWDCTCGNRGITGAFCSACGAKRPAPAPKEGTWDCECGNKGNAGAFCSACGAKKPAPVPKEDTWDCECGKTGNTGAFCDNCGKPKP